MDFNGVFALANSGDAEAQYAIGSLFLTGEGVPQDSSIAYKYILAAAEQGLIDAQHDLASMYKIGDGVGQSIQEALKWYTAAATQGELDSQFILGSYYRTGDEGVQRDFSLAFQWFAKAAENGDADSQYQLGCMYVSGEGVPENPSEGAKWLKAAADQGNSDAQWMYAICLKDGAGVNKNEPLALQYFTKSAEQGNAEGQFNLGCLLRDGIGCQPNLVQAMQWFQLASQQNNDGATYNLAVLYEDNSPALAAQLYEKLAAKGVSDAQYNLGVMYMNGTGVPANMQRAIELFKQAALQGAPDAAFNLGIIYGQGAGVPMDISEARKWFSMAANFGDQEAVQKIQECDQLLKANGNSNHDSQFQSSNSEKDSCYNVTDIHSKPEKAEKQGAIESSAPAYQVPSKNTNTVLCGVIAALVLVIAILGGVIFLGNNGSWGKREGAALGSSTVANDFAKQESVSRPIQVDAFQSGELLLRCKFSYEGNNPFPYEILDEITGYRFEYTYEENNHVTDFKCIDGDEVYYHEYTDYIQDGDNLVGKTYKDGELTKETTYNEDGLMISEKGYWDNGNYLASEALYEYNEMGKTTYSANTTYLYGYEPSGTIFTNSYDENGNLTETVLRSIDGHNDGTSSAYTNTTRYYSFKYDEQGRAIKATGDIEYADGSYMPIFCEYVYDDYGNVIATSTYTSSDNGDSFTKYSDLIVGKDGQRTSVSFDENGNCLALYNTNDWFQLNYIYTGYLQIRFINDYSYVNFSDPELADINPGLSFDDFGRLICADAGNDTYIYFVYEDSSDSGSTRNNDREEMSYAADLTSEAAPEATPVPTPTPIPEPDLYQELVKNSEAYDPAVETPMESEMMDQPVINYIKGSNYNSSSGGMYLYRSPDEDRIKVLKPHTPVTIYAVRGSYTNRTGYAFVGTNNGEYGWVKFQAARDIGISETNDF